VWETAQAGVRWPCARRDCGVSTLSVFALVQTSAARARQQKVCRIKRLRVLAKEARERAEEALSLAEIFRDPEARRILREVAQS